MKKLSIFLLGALGMMAASCDDAPAEATPQSNAQEPILAVGDITSATSGALASNAVLALEDYNTVDATVPVMQLVSTNNLPAGATVSYKLELSDSESFARSVVLDASTAVDGQYSVDAASWNSAHVYLFGKSPKVKTAYYRVPVYVNLDGSDYRYQAVDFYAAQGTIQETCQDMGFVIEDNYYLLSSATTWDLGNPTAYAFEHSDADPYDDPVFTIKFEVTQAVIDANGGDWWKIAPASAVASQNWDAVIGVETNGDENLSGILVDTNAQAGNIVVPGKYKMTVNMETMTYDIQLMLQAEYLYTPGDANGWSHNDSAWMQLNSDNGYYYGCFPVSGYGFKVCTENSWDNEVTFGASDTAGVFTSPGGNITATDGVYWVVVNYDPQTYLPTTYSLTEITSVGLIGSFAASGWSSDVLMSTADGGKTWTADLTINAGEEFKIRFNGGWAYNFGGNMNQLVMNGDNIGVSESGTYAVTLSLQPGFPKVTMTKK
jgi:hypothetical protein